MSDNDDLVWPEHTDPLEALVEYRDIKRNIQPLLARLEQLETQIKDYARTWKTNLTIIGATVNFSPGQPYQTLPKAKWQQLALTNPDVAEAVEDKISQGRVSIRVF